MKNNKAITLVALVITIIILLILAGITISQLTGSGLFENAKLAEEKSKNAQEKEQGILSDYENKINEYLEGSRNTNISMTMSELQNLINEAINDKINNISTSNNVSQGVPESGFMKDAWNVEKIGNRVFISGYVNGPFTEHTLTKVVTGLPKTANGNVGFNVGSDYGYGYGFVNGNGDLYIIANASSGSLSLFMNFSYTTCE